MAFGVLSPKEYCENLTTAELRERMGVPVKDTVELVMNAPERQLFQQMLFTKIVPNCKKLGLLDAGDGWLGTKFGELGVIQFEDWADTGAEYDEFSVQEEIAAGRAASVA